MKRNGKKATEKDGAKAQASPVRQSPRKRPCTDKKGEEEDRHVWLDSDAKSIDCGICFMPFEAEVFMCINGHTACAGCSEGLHRKCWCKAAIGEFRCRPAENMLAEMNTSCKFSIYGCAEAIKFVKKRAHEETCRHAPYGCPVDGCSYRGLNTGLYEHVVEEHAREVCTVAYLEATTVTLHRRTPFRLLMLQGHQGSIRRLFLLLNAGGGGGGGDVQAPAAGRSLCLVCLGPRPEGSVDIKYKMEVRGTDGDGGGGALSLVGTAPCIRDVEGFEPNKFLFVPDAYWGPSASVSVSVRIG